MPDFSTLERYRPICGNWADFSTALARPLPVVIWANPLRVSAAGLAELLRTDGIPFEPLGWQPGAFRLAADARPGLHWAFWAGLYHVQEEVSLLPVALLNPQPGDRVLDLCAAPGNKTAQIGLRLQNRGTVVANDINAGRMRATRQTLERLGLVNVSTTVADGANYPRRAGLFDRVLVDAPCSCEGTSRKEPEVLRRTGPDFSGRKVGLQAALLKKAVQLCRPGGRVVYSTCTYAPEENEQVVEAVLRHFGGDVLQLRPARLPNFAAEPGLTEWQGQKFDPSLVQAMRVWPQQNDTGGFFVAVLEKTAALPRPADPAPAPIEPTPDPPTVELLRRLVIEHFGMAPEMFDSLRVFPRSKRRVYVVNADHRPPPQPAPDATGMLLLNTHIKYPKLSTSAAILLGQAATRNVVDLTPPQMQAYLNRQTAELSAGQVQRCGGKGYVIARYRGYSLGVGVFHPGESGGALESMFPKSWSPGGRPDNRKSN